MKKIIILLIIFLPLSLVQINSQDKATFINKKGEIMDTQDGGKTWHIRNKPYQKYFIDNSKATLTKIDSSKLIKKAFFIKNGVTKITVDGGNTWNEISNDNAKGVQVNGQINLYPNPVTKDYTHIVLPATETGKKVNVFVYDMTGTNMLTVELAQENGSNEFALNISSLQNGRYILKLVTEHELYTASMTVTR